MQDDRGDFLPLLNVPGADPGALQVVDITPTTVQTFVTKPARVVVPGNPMNRAYRRAEAADKRKSKRSPK